ncbi:hypothetical protein HZC20_03195 [Candidatus Peregrinibacteria bacterium]|nr:hypothetical protein [Candidatus Peregrinibacteria bacterium]
MKAKYVTIIYLLLCLGVLFLGFSYFYLTNDDSYISARYARNLSGGYGFVSNYLGETQEGYSNLFFVLLVSLLNSLFSIDFIIGEKIIGIFSIFFAGIFSSLILNLFVKVIREDMLIDKVKNTWLWQNTSLHVLNILMLLAIVSSTWFIFWATQGLETILYSALLLAATYMLMYSFVNKKYWMLTIVALVAFLGLNTRPEGIMNFLLIVILIVAWCIFRRKCEKGVVKYGLYFLAISILLILLLIGWKELYFGDFIANPTYIKMAFSIWHRDFLYFINYFSKKGLLFSIIVIASFIGATWIIIRNVLCNRHARLNIIFLTLLGFLFSQFFFILVSGGDYMPYGRFFVTHYPYFIMLAFFTFVISSLNFTKIITYIGLSLLTLIFLYSGSVREKVVNLRWWETGFIGVDQVHELQNTIQYRAVKKLNKLMNNTTKYFATSEFGYVAYNTVGRGLDMIGLNQKEIARNFSLYGIKEAVYANRDYILSKKPKVIVALNEYRDNTNHSIVIDPGQQWFLEPYYKSDFFLSNYEVTVPEGRKTEDWSFNIWNDNYKSTNLLTWDDERNEDKLMYGFYEKEPDHRWMSSLARVLIRQGEGNNFLVFSGIIPDIRNYSNKEVVIEIRGNDEAVGDLVLARKTIKESGKFSIKVPWALEGEDALITIRVTSMISQNPKEKRELSVIFDYIRFGNE